MMTEMITLNNEESLGTSLPVLAISVTKGISFFNLALYPFLALLYYTFLPEATKKPPMHIGGKGFLDPGRRVDPFYLVKSIISLTAFSIPAITARATMLWPMFNSSTPGILATRVTFP